MTPTEAAVIAAVYALFVGLFIYRELKLSDLPASVLQAAKTTSVDHVPGLRGAGLGMADHGGQYPGRGRRPISNPLIDRPKLLMLVIMLLVLVVGTALDLTPTILILTPVLMPIIIKAGIDPVYFGVMFIMNYLHRPDHAAGRRRAERGQRRRPRAARARSSGASGPSCWRRCSCCCCWSCSQNSSLVPLPLAVLKRTKPTFHPREETL